MSTQSSETEGRDLTGETVMGMRVAAYMWEEPSGFDPPSSTTVERFATHWSTPGKRDNAERLFRESDVRRLLDLAQTGASRPVGGEDEPALWGVFNPLTGRFRTRAFRDEQSAAEEAVDRSDVDLPLVARPLFAASRPVGDREQIARLCALHGLGSVNGFDQRKNPIATWTQEEWERRILECVPGRVERQCYALADAILSGSEARPDQQEVDGGGRG